MFSTFEPGPVNVKVYIRSSSGAAWLTDDDDEVYEADIYPGQPITWPLSRDKTLAFFRYATSSSKYTPSWLQSNKHGLKIVASKTSM